jgi:hypothetical protein
MGRSFPISRGSAGGKISDKNLKRINIEFCFHRAIPGIKLSHLALIYSYQRHKPINPNRITVLGLDFIVHGFNEGLVRPTQF